MTAASCSRKRGDDDRTAWRRRNILPRYNGEVIGSLMIQTLLHAFI